MSEFRRTVVVMTMTSRILDRDSAATLARAFLCFVVFAVAWFGCSRSTPGTTMPSTPTTIKVGYLPVSTTLPTWLAKSEGFAAKRGVAIEFVRFANADLMLLALISGEIQATSVCADEPILSAASRAKLDAEIYLQEILTTDRVFDAILVKFDSSASSIKSLKSIACFPGSQLKAYLAIILEKNGIDPSTVSIQQLPPPNMLPALESGTVDACFALEPTITIGTKRGIAKVLLPSPIVQFLGDGKPICAASYLISRKWAHEHPEAADGFVRAVYESVDLIEKDYLRVSTQYPDFTPIPAELAKFVVITHFARNDKPDLDGLRVEERVLRDSGLLDGPINIDALIYQWKTKP